MDIWNRSAYRNVGNFVDIVVEWNIGKSDK